MRSLLLTHIGELALQEAPEPDIPRGYVAVKVSRCALCRTDAKMWSQGQRDLVLPRVLGHEISGIREDTKERCVVWPGEACGSCDQCLSGVENLCPSMKILGFNRDGGLSEKVVAPTAALMPVPPTLDDTVASLAEPLACALNGLEQTRVGRGDDVLVLGGGPVGLLIALAVTSLNGSPLVLETSERRLFRSKEFRKALGIVGVAKPPPGGFDVAFNACPAPAAPVTAISLLRPSGRLGLFSGLTGSESIALHSVNEIHYRQLTVIGAYGCTRSQFMRALGLLDRFRNEIRLLVDQEIPLEETESALKAILAGDVMKIVVNPGMRVGRTGKRPD